MKPAHERIVTGGQIMEGRVFNDEVALTHGATDMSYGMARHAAEPGLGQPIVRFLPQERRKDVAGSIVGHLLSAVNGSAISRGASFLRGDLGKQILPFAMGARRTKYRSPLLWLPGRFL